MTTAIETEETIAETITKSDANMARLERLLLPYVWGDKDKDTEEYIQLGEEYLGAYRLNCFLHGRKCYR